jgi:hypothetical protein
MTPPLVSKLLLLLAGWEKRTEVLRELFGQQLKLKNWTQKTMLSSWGSVPSRVLVCRYSSAWLQAPCVRYHCHAFHHHQGLRIGPQSITLARMFLLLRLLSQSLLTSQEKSLTVIASTVMTTR